MSATIEASGALSEKAQFLVEKIINFFPFIEKIKVDEDNDLMTIHYFSCLENGSIVLKKENKKLFFKELIIMEHSVAFSTN